MTGIIRKRALVLVSSALLALSGKSNFGLEVTAFGVPTTSRITVAHKVQTKKSALCMQSDIGSNNSGNAHRNRNPKKCRRSTVRKAALVDDPSSSSSDGIRSRVHSFLRSKKTRKNKFVEEVTDIDAIKHLLGESKRATAYTAVIFHAPYCKACKASMPLFEKLAKKYTSKAQKQGRIINTSSWIASKSALQRQESEEASATTATGSIDSDRQEPNVRFLSVPVTQDNAEQLQDRFGVTKFPLAHIYDPMEGLVDERPVLRKLFAGFEERLASVVVSAPNNNFSNVTTSL